MNIQGRWASLSIAAVLVAACTGTAGGRNEAGDALSLPPALAAAEALTEDVQADIDAQGWVAAAAKASTLRHGAGAVAEAAAAERDEVGFYLRAVDSLATQVARRDRLAALASANSASRVLVALGRDYRTRVPAQVGLLDVAGRDAIYAAEGGRWTAAAAAVGELQACYQVVSAHVASAAATLDARVRHTLGALARAVAARDTAGVRQQTTALLDDVDLIESSY